jgi:amino acid transporter
LTVSDIPTLLQSQTGFPFIDMFYAATKSYAATNVMTAIMVINLTASAIAVLATASRQLWAFARNRGFPFSLWLAPTVLPKDIPVNTLFVSLGFTICLSLINIGSSAALNAIFSLNTGSLISSYLITISCTIIHRLRSRTLPKARFSLGRWGLPINIAAICYLLPVFVFSFFPSTPNPTPVTMNWGIVMYSGVIIISTLYYVFQGRFTFSPPTEQTKHIIIDDINRNYDENMMTPEPEQERIDVTNEKSLDKSM